MSRPPPFVAPVYSTIAASEIRRAVEANWAVGQVAGCHLLRRGFNDVYELRSAGGGRLVPRLANRRPRGAANTAYETGLLRCLQTAGVAVAGALPTRSGADWIELQAPEGARPLVVFEHLDGHAPGRDLSDIGLMGAELARIHEASIGYDGPPSLYHLDLDHLLLKPLSRLAGAPTVNSFLQDGFCAIAARLQQTIGDGAGLARAHCHGDCHGSNAFIVDRPVGRRAAFFDFDEAGPGWLAYELAVYLWYLAMRKGMAVGDEKLAARWQAFLDGYRSVRATPSADLDAVPLFVGVRHLWFLGEFASRVPEWGAESLSTNWLGAELEHLGRWVEADALP